VSITTGITSSTVGRLCLLLALLASAACGSTAPDTVIVNGRVFTANADRPWAEALAVRGDRIVAIGSTAEIAALAGPDTTRHDAAGRTVIPGLNDAHVSDPGGDARAIAAFAQRAVAAGVTSMQWFVAQRTVRAAGETLVAAATPLRVRMLRMPRPGPDGEIDSRPHLPPQPTLRIDIRGMGHVLGAGDEKRIRQVVGWAYGTEDLLAIEPLDAAALALYLDAVEHTGVPEVWARKRPRIESADATARALASRLAAAGLVMVARPGGTVPLAALVQSGVPLALGTGSGTDPFAALAWATAGERGAEALTMSQAVTAMTRGSAFAELADRDKGHLSVGALADLAVLSRDPFADGPLEPGAVRSVLTMIGGLVVHDVP